MADDDVTMEQLAGWCERWLGAVFAAGLGWPVWQAGLRALLQAQLAPGARGATFAALEAATATAVVPAWLLGGWAADQWGARAVIAAAPLVHLLLGIWLWLTPRVRRATLDVDEASRTTTSTPPR